jgi:hypothetical protein
MSIARAQALLAGAEADPERNEHTDQFLKRRDA